MLDRKLTKRVIGFVYLTLQIVMNYFFDLSWPVLECIKLYREIMVCKNDIVTVVSNNSA